MLVMNEDPAHLFPEMLVFGSIIHENITRLSVESLILGPARDDWDSVPEVLSNPELLIGDCLIVVLMRNSRQNYWIEVIDLEPAPEILRSLHGRKFEEEIGIGSQHLVDLAARELCGPLPKSEEEMPVEIAEHTIEIDEVSPHNCVISSMKLSLA